MTRVAGVTVVLGAITVLLALGGCPPVPVLRLIFDQGNFAHDGYVSILDGVDHSPSPQVAEAFMLYEGFSTIRVVQWWGTQDPAITDADDFLVRIFEDDGSGLPRIVPLYAIPVGDVERTNTGQTAKPEMGSPPIYEYSVELIPFDLAPETTYYLSIVNTTGHDWVWMWTDEMSNSTGAYSRLTDEEDWAASLTYDVAFRLWQ